MGAQVVVACENDVPDACLWIADDLRFRLWRCAPHLHIVLDAGTLL